MEPRLEVLYFTDPFCSWCWASEPQLYRLREIYRGGISFRSVMGGLVEDMSRFHDAANGIRSTADVAPHWREVSAQSGQPIDERVMTDITDPHWSTWPACIAVKAAQLQSDDVGERYLRRMRRAVMTERVNVSERDVQLDLARQVDGLDVERFETDLDGNEAKEAFTADRHLGMEYGATGFPTLLFVNPAGAEGPTGMLVNGYRPSSTLERVAEQLVPGLERKEPRSVAEMLAEYGPMTTKELAEVLDQEMGALRMELERTEGVRRIEVPHGELWAFE